MLGTPGRPPTELRQRDTYIRITLYNNNDVCAVHARPTKTTTAIRILCTWYNNVAACILENLTIRAPNPTTTTKPARVRNTRRPYPRCVGCGDNNYCGFFFFFLLNICMDLFSFSLHPVHTRTTNGIETGSPRHTRTFVSEQWIRRVIIITITNIVAFVLSQTPEVRARKKRFFGF